MGLCSNRPGGFGPKSSIHPSVPTSCFNAVILVPLSTWLYILLLGVLLALVLPRRRSSSQNQVKTKSRKTVVFIILTTIYYIFVVGMIAMVCLEIARLTKAHIGIGLLWFTIIGLLIAGILHHFLSLQPVRVVNALFWAFLAATLIVSLVALQKEEPTYNRLGVQMNYPLGDEVTDVSVMAGLSIALVFLEFVGWKAQGRL